MAGLCNQMFKIPNLIYTNPAKADSRGAAFFYAFECRLKWLVKTGNQSLHLTGSIYIGRNTYKASTVPG
jgi:hypothetical protein